MERDIEAIEDINESKGKDVVDPEEQGGGGQLGGHGDHGDGAIQDGIACPVGQVAWRLLQVDEVAPIFSDARHLFVGADAIEVVEHLVGEVLVEDLSKAGVDEGDDSPLHAFLVGLQLLQQADSRLDDNNLVDPRGVTWALKHTCWSEQEKK